MYFYDTVRLLCISYYLLCRFFLLFAFQKLLNHAILTLIGLALYALLCRYVMSEIPWAGWFPATEIRHGSPGLFF